MAAIRRRKSRDVSHGSWMIISYILGGRFFGEIYFLFSGNEL